MHPWVIGSNKPNLTNPKLDCCMGALKSSGLLWDTYHLILIVVLLTTFLGCTSANSSFNSKIWTFLQIFSDFSRILWIWKIFSFLSNQQNFDVICNFGVWKARQKSIFDGKVQIFRRTMILSKLALSTPIINFCSKYFSQTGGTEDVLFLLYTMKSI